MVGRLTENSRLIGFALPKERHREDKSGGYAKYSAYETQVPESQTSAASTQITVEEMIQLPRRDLFKKLHPDSLRELLGKF